MTLPNFNTLTRDEALAFILSGMQAKRAEIDATLRDLRSQLNVDEATTRKDIALAQAEMTRQYTGHRQVSRYIPDFTPPRKRRKLSRAARKAISDAQKRRWAKVRA